MSVDRNIAVTLAFAITLATGARAQDAGGSTPTADQAPPATGQVNTSSNQLEDIVVTAQKRSENVQNVPIAITAVDNARLQNTSASLSTVNLQQFVPGLVQGRSGTAGATFLRGVGTEAGVVGTEAPVPTYIDGIYLGINSLGVFELNNIDQISVLKGPQGTLFGRNATGGAIQITTKNPNLDHPELRMEAGYGNYETATIRAYGSTPITDTLAANFSVLYKHRNEGTVYNVHTGNDLQADKTLSGQGKIVWQPDSNTRVTLNGIYNRGRDLPGLNYFVQKGAVSQDGQTTYLGPHTVNLFTDSYQSVSARIGALTIAHDLGWAKITNTVSRTVYKSRAFNDQSMTPGLPNPANIAPSNSHLNADVREATEELQLQSEDSSKLKWIVGFFYFNDRTDTSLRVTSYTAAGARPGFGLNTQLGTDSYAGYAQATYEILPRTNITAGLRYTEDEKSLNGTNVFGGTVPPSVDKNVSFGKLTWRFALDHKFGDNILGYASYNRGFRAGTYSTLSLSNPAAKPETLDAYEVGLKSDLFGRVLRVNVAGFYYDYSDLQLRENVGSPITALILNAATAHIYGADIDFEAKATRNLRLVGGLEVLHARYSDFPSGPKNFPVGQPQLGLAPITTVPVGCTGAVRGGGLAVGGHSSTVSCDLSGNDLINAPRFSATIGADYTMPTQIGNFTLSASDKYTGKSYASPDNVQVLSHYHFVTASLSWTSSNETFFGKLYVTNLTNSGRPAQEAFSLNTYEFLPNEPRFYGFTVGFKY